MLNAAVSGSFHRHLEAITAAVHELMALSVRVLSPADPRVVARQGEFLFVASDRITSVRLVQDRHLESIRAADFLWIVCPDGYVGQSASMEIGFAGAVGVPIFATHQPADLTLRQYVRVVPDLKTAVRMTSARAQRRQPEGFLIDPRASVQKAHYILEKIASALSGTTRLSDPAPAVLRNMAHLQATLALPTYMQ